MDDFREWLSDNLRYFMLGGAILLVLIVLIVGIRACTGSGKKSQDAEDQAQQEAQVTPSSTNDNSQSADGEEEEVQLTQAEADVTALIENYYKAMSDKDVDTLGTLVDDLSPADESQITNASDYIERYEVSAVYEKPGMDENSYVVYASFQYYCQGITTAVPALSQFYVVKGEDGTLKISNSAESDSSISAYMTKLKAEADVQQLLSDVKDAYDKAQTDDPELKEFLAGLGEDDDTATADSEQDMVVANDECNVRDTPNGDIIGGLSVGDTVVKLGVEDDWVKIEYEGEEAYVYGTLVDDAE